MKSQRLLFLVVSFQEKCFNQLITGIIIDIINAGNNDADDDENGDRW